MNKTIYYPFTFLNEYIATERANKYKAAKIKRDTTFYIRMAFNNHQHIKTPVRIKFTWLVPNKRRDLDNLAFACKYILDGMVKANVIPSDNLVHIVELTHCYEISDNVGVRIETY